MVFATQGCILRFLRKMVETNIERRSDEEFYRISEVVGADTDGFQKERGCRVLVAVHEQTILQSSEV